MRIGIDARFYGSIGKGLGRYTEKLIEYLEIFDTENEYLIFLLQENFDEYTPKNKNFKKVLAQYPWYSFSEQILFPLQLFFSHLDLVHFPHFNVPFLYPKKFVVTIHDLILLRYPTIENTTRSKLFYKVKFLAYRFIIACAIYRAKCVITVSHFTEEDILARYSFARGKLLVTYEATDSLCQFLSKEKEYALFERLKLLSDTVLVGQEKNLHGILKPYLLYVGNAYPHKNLEALLNVSLEFPAYKFVLVGKEDYFYTRLKKRAEEQGIQNIIFAGFASDWELNSLYHFASCYLFPSFYEGFGLPPLEAMVRGLPVLSSSCGSLPEILGDAAMYFDPHRKESFREKLQEILTSDTLRQELIRRGYEQIKRYSFDRMAQETLEIYTQSIKNKE
ncbi:MAG: glycosyltransferase family 1 protein [Candidatus Moraniibacteriota bacterium]